MRPVPLTLYLARRDRTPDDPLGGPNALDIQAATEAWYEKGLVEGREKAKAAYEAVLAQKEEDYKFRIDQARKTWAEIQATALAQQTADAIANLKSEIGETVARILRPLVEKRLVEEALAKLAIEIGELTSDDDAIRLKVCGPSDLLSQLNKQIPLSIPLTTIAGDYPEVTVFANKTVIETRLKEWLACTGVNSHASEEEG